jgi:spermidine/putrescine transport system ATP-binding protein
MVGVRPEKIRLHGADAEVPAGQNRMLGRVRDASYLGVSTSYVVESRHGDRLTVYEQNVERTSQSSLHRPGDEVQLSWSPDHTFAVSIDDAPGATGNQAVRALDAASEGVLTA